MIKKIRNLLGDSSLDFQSKSFVLLASIALIGLFIALISGIILGQSFMANLSVFIEFVLFFGLYYWAVFHNRIKKALIIISAFLIFVFLPAAFFTSGGAAGGTPVWCAFTTLFIVMTLSGKPKVFFLIANFIVVAICWWIGYNYPGTVTEFTRKEAFYDSFFTLLIVCTSMTLLVGYQALLFRKENERVESQKREIEELNQSQKRFFSSLSHEIRTPINSILGFNEVILRQEDASEEIKSDASYIQGAGKMLLAIVNDILDFSKIDAGKMDIIPMEYKVAEMISEIVNMFWQRANEKGLAFNVDIDPQIPSSLIGDEVRIKQIIVNLLSNAIKYTESGSVRLRLDPEACDDKHIVLIISVSDTGMGIKQEVIPTLFDAFKREDQEKNIRIEGTGLGLSIVKQLAELMEGEVAVESIYGQGTVFTVRIRQEVANTQKIGKVDLSDHTKQKKSYRSMFTAPEAEILIVDDSKMNLTVEQKLLRDTKIKIDTATSGAEALELTVRKKYDVILMDHFMPEMDGPECLGRIRSQEDGMCRDVPVIILTANAKGENQEMYKAIGFDGFLVKPISGVKLEEALIQYIPQEKIINYSKNQTADNNHG